VWEDEASPEDRFRRVQQVTPRTGRTLPGMPLEMDDPDDDASRPRRRYEEPKGRWWRPASTMGRIFLAAGALAVMVALITGYITLAQFLKRDARFRIAGVSNIQLNGLTEVSRAEMLPAFGADVGKNIFFIHLSERRKQLEQIPWVEHATVMRLLPNQIRVSIVERKPVAFVRVGQQIELVDADGALLSMAPATIAKHHYSFPVVTGIDSSDSLASRGTRMAVYQRLISELDSTGQHLSNQISEIDLTDPEDARVLMPEQGADILAHFGDEQFLTRYQRYKAHIAEWRQQYPRLAAVDLRYDQQVVLQMTGDAAASKTIATGDASAGGSSAESAKPSPDGKADAAVATKAPAATQHRAHAAKPAHKAAFAKKKHAASKRAGVTHRKPASRSNGLRQEQ
jgi:cell division protein FtsQ